MKLRLKSAKKGYNLLKKKAEALLFKFRSLLKAIIKSKSVLCTELQEAFISMAQATFQAGDFSHLILENSTTPTIKVRITTDIVAGVKLPVFQRRLTGTDAYQYTGLGKGGKQISVCKAKFIKATELLLELASLKTSFQALNEAIKATRRRVNALEYIIVPRLEKTVEYVISELEEKDREEFFRLKRVQDKKKIRRDAPTGDGPTYFA
ncbi:hypothetical protein Zmor_004149 [Zophobas morio]|uniref:V-type proton ATPase subunit D n=1 Tax=Zophobas morio TaxID=2755281 RepID=A0AA38HN24_9CUCU|nr:hypothetical protein Zmor_004149 [Zophobas morio]